MALIVLGWQFAHIVCLRVEIEAFCTIKPQMQVFPHNVFVPGAVLRVCAAGLWDCVSSTGEPMSLTESTSMAMGTPAPDFTLPSTDGVTVSLADFSRSPLMVVIFMCNHCPYVIHISSALAELAEEFMPRGVSFVGINSNDTQAYPADSFDKMKEEKALRGYPFAYLWDESQAVARAYDAACTPDIYVFDAERKLAYRGQFDETRPHRISSGNYDSTDSPATGDTLRAILVDLLNGAQGPEKQYPSMGCNIKWRENL